MIVSAKAIAEVPIGKAVTAKGIPRTEGMAENRTCHDGITFTYKS